jgi:hypothetical protein
MSQKTYHSHGESHLHFHDSLRPRLLLKTHWDRSPLTFSSNGSQGEKRRIKAMNTLCGLSHQIGLEWGVFLETFYLNSYPLIRFIWTPHLGAHYTITYSGSLKKSGFNLYSSAVRYRWERSPDQTKRNRVAQYYWLFDCKHFMKCTQHHNLISLKYSVSSNTFMNASDAD